MSPREELAELYVGLKDAQKESLAKFVSALGPASSDRSQLLDVLADLDDEKIRRVLSITRALARDIREVLNSGSLVVTRPFADEFRMRLLAHHATHTTKLDRLGFENAFLAASKAAGRETEEAPSRTTRFWDVRVDDVQTALKSEGARNMKADYLHISKLSEAAWIQDVRSAKSRHEHMVAFMFDFLDAVEDMFVLRISYARDLVTYELVEIPVDHFRRILDLPISAFDSDAPRIPIEDEHGSIMELRLDRSDAKITISKLRKDRCIVHATWSLDPR
jgi:hypothetical protein